MRSKTFVSVSEQWERTAQLFLRATLGDYRDVSFLHLGSDWQLGFICSPHRLFLPGDVVAVSEFNGSGRRQPVWSFTSKGFAVRRYYLKYATDEHDDTGQITF